MNARDIIVVELFYAVDSPGHQMGKAVVNTHDLAAAIVRLKGDGADRSIDTRRRTAAHDNPHPSYAVRMIRLDAHDCPPSWRCACNVEILLSCFAMPGF